jgi:hypothetical protein
VEQSDFHQGPSAATEMPGFIAGLTGKPLQVIFLCGASL